MFGRHDQATVLILKPNSCAWNCRGRSYSAKLTNGTRYALCIAAPQRQQLVNCGSSCSPHCAHTQGAPDGAAAAFSNARSAADSSSSSTITCMQVSSMV